MPASKPRVKSNGLNLLLHWEELIAVKQSERRQADQLQGEYQAGEGKFQDVVSNIANQVNDKSSNETRLWTIDPPVIYRVQPQQINPTPYPQNVYFIGKNFGNWRWYDKKRWVR